MVDRLTLAQRLLKDHPSKALELLIDYLKDESIQAKTEIYIGQNPPQRNPEMALEYQHGALTPRSHHRNSSAHQGSARHNTQIMRNSIQTPPTSAGSNRSYASGLAAAGMEKITFLSCDDDSADQPVIARRAPGKHNLIGDDVAYSGRGLSAGQFEVDESILVHTSSGAARPVSVKAAVNLTWRSRNTFKTNMGTFYIVSASLLDSDVVLGSDESVERQFPSDIHEAHSPQDCYPSGFIGAEDVSHAVRPRAPTVPLYTQSSLQQPPEVQRTYQLVNDTRNAQLRHEPEPPTPPIQSTNLDNGQPSHITPPAAGQAATSGQLQVNGFWGTTPISMSFNPNESGEKFFQAFHRWAVKRKRGDDVDRSRMTLWLKADKHMSDDAAQDLSLDYNELENLWATAVAWMHENKSTKAPHLYATVEIVEIEDG